MAFILAICAEFNEFDGFGIALCLSESGSELLSICFNLFSVIAPACIASHCLSVICIALFFLEIEPTCSLYFVCIRCDNLANSSPFKLGSASCLLFISDAANLVAVLSFILFFLASFSLIFNSATSFLYISAAFLLYFRLPGLYNFYTGSISHCFHTISIVGI